MNKLLFPYGGFPIYSDELNFQFNAFRAGIVASVKGFAKDNKCILFGMVPTITTSDVSITEGWMYWEDDLLYCPAQSRAINPGQKLSDFFLYKSQTNSFPVLMDDGNVEPIHQSNHVSLLADLAPIPAVHLALSEMNNYRLRKIISPIVETDVLTLSNGWTVSFGSSFLIKKVLGNVTIQGNLTGAVTQGGVKIGRLPLGFRPISECYFMCRTGVASFYEVRIGVNGDVYIDGSSGRVSVSFNFTFINN